MSRTTPPPIDTGYLTATLATAVSIDSTNPSLSSTGAGEAELARFVASELESLGLAVTVAEVAPGRPNVAATVAGSEGGRSLMWNGHLDTVGVDGVEDPFVPRIEAGRLYGRGAHDMKGALAAMLAAAKALVDGGVSPPGDIVVAAVCDEEYGSIGTEALLGTVHPDGAVVAEPTGLRLATAHRGFVEYEIETAGRAAHGSRPEDGIDAIVHMGRVLAGLDALEQGLRERPADAVVGRPSVHASVIDGGTELSVYPASCRLLVERRTVPGETPADTDAEMHAIIAAEAADPEFSASLTRGLARAPLTTDPGSMLAACLGGVLAGRGLDPRPIGVPFWTDAALLAAAGVDAVVMGPAGGGLHSAVEWVDLASLEELAAILVATALRYGEESPSGTESAGSG